MEDKIIVIKKLLMRLKYSVHIWIMMSKNSFLAVTSQKTTFAIFLFGKLLRFAFFILFLYFIVSGADSLAGYSFQQTLFFFLTFMVVDTVSQFFFREVYRFRPLVISGDLDLVLVKPINALYRVLLGGADFIDLVTMPPLFIGLVYVAAQLSPTGVEILGYILLLLNSFLISTAFHIMLLAFGIMTLEIDHSVMIYRDLTAMGRFPVDIYREPLRGVLTYILPVGVMLTIPAKVLMGIVAGPTILLFLGIGFISVYFSLRFWEKALKSYTSASS